MPKGRKDKELTFRTIYPSMRGKEIKEVNKHNEWVSEQINKPDVVIHTNNLVREELEKFKEEQAQYEPKVVVHEGRSEEEQILELAREALSDIKDVAQIAGPGIVVRFFMSALKLGAAGAVGLDAVMGALNNTSQERDFEAPPSNSPKTSGAPKPG